MLSIHVLFNMPLNPFIKDARFKKILECLTVMFSNTIITLPPEVLVSTFTLDPRDTDNHHDQGVENTDRS